MRAQRLKKYVIYVLTVTNTKFTYRQTDFNCLFASPPKTGFKYLTKNERVYDKAHMIIFRIMHFDPNDRLEFDSGYTLNFAIDDWKINGLKLRKNRNPLLNSTPEKILKSRTLKYRVSLHVFYSDIKITYLYHNSKQINMDF